MMMNTTKIARITLIFSALTPQIYSVESIPKSCKNVIKENERSLSFIAGLSVVAAVYYCNKNNFFAKKITKKNVFDIFAYESETALNHLKNERSTIVNQSNDSQITTIMENAEEEIIHIIDQGTNNISSLFNNEEEDENDMKYSEEQQASSNERKISAKRIEDIRDKVLKQVYAVKDKYIDQLKKFKPINSTIQTS